MYMETMASTSHGLSVFANSCIKTPNLPKAGFSSTLPINSSIYIRYDDALSEVKRSGEVNNDVSEWLQGENQFAAFVLEQLRESKAEEFYEKLQQLKEENRKTLEAYEKLYVEKLTGDDVRNSLVLQKSVDYEVDRVQEFGSDELYLENSLQNGDLKRDHVSKKPPVGRPSKKFHEPHLSKTMPSNTVSMYSRGLAKASLPGRLKGQASMRKSRSLDNEEWSTLFLHSENKGDDEDFVIPTDTLSDHERALLKVDKLWEDFDIAKYSKRRNSTSSGKGKGKLSSSRDGNTSEWRHRITIPQPFNMSIREALKDSKVSKTQYEAEQRRLEKEREEEAECAKQFKARPVPSHVYLPKFEEIMEKNESRRQYVKNYCQELLKSQVKPFNFEVREEEKKKQRAQSAPIKRPERPKTMFKAKPVPVNIFKPDVDERLQEEEELRKIRIRMRSKELLRESSLPPNMAEREKLKEQEKKEKALKAKQAARTKKRIKSAYRNAHIVPDYDMLYREFQKQLAQRKSVREGTVTEPFDLETERIVSHKNRIRRDIEKDEKTLKENRWPFEGSRETPRSSLRYLGTLSTSLDSIPTHLTRSAELRSSMIKKEKEREASKMKQREEEEKRRRVREAKLRRYLSEKANSDDVPRVRESIAERLRRKRQEERTAEEAYQRQIEEMKARIDDSPLLVEKFMKENAKKEAERKFTRTLRGAGFDESDFARGSGKPSDTDEDQLRSGGDSEDELGLSSTVPADTTYTKDGEEY